MSEDRLAARLEEVTARLAADAPNTERPGAELIAYVLPLIGSTIPIPSPKGDVIFG